MGWCLEISNEVSLPKLQKKIPCRAAREFLMDTLTKEGFFSLWIFRAYSSGYPVKTADLYFNLFDFHFSFIPDPRLTGRLVYLNATGVLVSIDKINLSSHSMSVNILFAEFYRL